MDPRAEMVQMVRGLMGEETNRRLVDVDADVNVNELHQQFYVLKQLELSLTMGREVQEEYAYLATPNSATVRNIFGKEPEQVYGSQKMNKTLFMCPEKCLRSKWDQSRRVHRWNMYLVVYKMSMVAVEVVPDAPIGAFHPVRAEADARIEGPKVTLFDTVRGTLSLGRPRQMLPYGVIHFRLSKEAPVVAPPVLLLDDFLAEPPPAEPNVIVIDDDDDDDGIAHAPAIAVPRGQ